MTASSPRPPTICAVFDELTKGLRPADIDQALRAIWAGREPQIFVTGPIQLADPKAAILAAYARQPRRGRCAAGGGGDRGLRLHRALASPPAWPRPEEIADLGITRVTLRQRRGLYVKRTPFEADTVHVAVRFGSGRIGLPADAAGPRPAGRARLRRRWARQQGIDEIYADPGVQAGRYRPRGRRERRQPARPDHPCRPAAAARPAGGLRAPIRATGRRRWSAYRAWLGSAYARLAAVPDGASPGPVARLLHDGDPRFGMPPQGGGGAAYAGRAARLARADAAARADADRHRRRHRSGRGHRGGRADVRRLAGTRDRRGSRCRRT